MATHANECQTFYDYFMVNNCDKTSVNFLTCCRAYTTSRRSGDPANCLFHGSLSVEVDCVAVTRGVVVTPPERAERRWGWRDGS